MSKKRKHTNEQTTIQEQKKKTKGENEKEEKTRKEIKRERKERENPNYHVELTLKKMWETLRYFLLNLFYFFKSPF